MNQTTSPGRPPGPHRTVVENLGEAEDRHQRTASGREHGQRAVQPPDAAGRPWQDRPAVCGVVVTNGPHPRGPLDELRAGHVGRTALAGQEEHGLLRKAEETHELTEEQLRVAGAAQQRPARRRGPHGRTRS